MRKSDRLRKKNCYRICEAFGPNFWTGWVDPLSNQNRHLLKQATQNGYHTCYYKGTPIHVPLEWYWREIADWELESLVTAWKLTHVVD